MPNISAFQNTNIQQKPSTNKIYYIFYLFSKGHRENVRQTTKGSLRKLILRKPLPAWMSLTHIFHSVQWIQANTRPLDLIPRKYRKVNILLMQNVILRFNMSTKVEKKSQHSAINIHEKCRHEKHRVYCIYWTIMFRVSGETWTLISNKIVIIIIKNVLRALISSDFFVKICTLKTIISKIRTLTIFQLHGQKYVTTSYPYDYQITLKRLTGKRSAQSFSWYKLVSGNENCIHIAQNKNFDVTFERKT